MFEVIVTYRDFSEKAVHRCTMLDEARAAAKHLWDGQPDQIVRAWVRQVREAKTSQ